MLGVNLFDVLVLFRCEVPRAIARARSPDTWERDSKLSVYDSSGSPVILVNRLEVKAQKRTLAPSSGIFSFVEDTFQSKRSLVR